MKKIIIIFLLIVPFSFGQSTADTTFSVEVNLTVSPLFSFFRDERIPGLKDRTAVGYGGFVRVMWHPGHLLAMGLMSGYTFIVKDEINLNNISTKELNNLATARLTAIPLQIAVSMQSRGAEFGVGMGPYLMQSYIDYGTVALGKRLELGLTFFGSYVFSVSDLIFLGPEFRLLYLSYRGIISFMPSITFHLEPLRY